MLYRLCPVDTCIHVEPARGRIANPKAVAAQTFLPRHFALEYHRSQTWVLIAPLFGNQRPVSNGRAVGEGLTGQDSILFPYSVSATHPEENAVGVWIDDNGIVRHVRLFNSPQAAVASNRLLSGLLKVKTELLFNAAKQGHAPIHRSQDSTSVPGVDDSGAGRTLRKVGSRPVD